MNLTSLSKFRSFCEESSHIYIWADFKLHKLPRPLVCWSGGWLDGVNFGHYVKITLLIFMKVGRYTRRVRCEKVNNLAHQLNGRVVG